jgi:ATP-binding cassette, subfamily B, bacterial PglK
VLTFARAVGQTTQLVTPGKRARWILLVALALVVTAFEALGAVLVLTLMGLITSSEPSLVLPVVGDIAQLLPEGMPARTLQLSAAAVVAGFFLLRAAVVVGQRYLQARMIHVAAAQLATRLVRGYLDLPYLQHTQINSSELVRNAFDSVQMLVTQVMKPAVEVVAETILVLGLTAVLLVVAPEATVIAVVVLGPAVWLLLAIVQPRLKRLGRASQEARNGCLQALQQALGGLRDIRLLSREDAFVDAFARQRRVVARTDYLKTALTELPRALIETALVLVIVLVFVFAVLSGRDTTTVLATLGVFAYVGLRLQPSLRHVVNGLNHVRFGAAVIDDLRSDRRRIDAANAERSARLDGRPRPLREKIEFQAVSFAYSSTAAPVLHGVDLTIRRGEFVGICGPTGGGKSTLVDLLVGLLQPSSGEVLVDGSPLGEHPVGWYAELGVVSQSVFLIDDSLRRNIAFGWSDDEIDEDRLRRAVSRAQLEPVVAGLPGGLETVVGERGVRLSGGQRQRVAVARALYREPSVIVLDEGTSALDSATEAALVAAMDELKLGRTLISVAHRISTVRGADRIVVVEGGRVLAVGRYDELLERSELFRSLAR